MSGVFDYSINPELTTGTVGTAGGVGGVNIGENVMSVPSINNAFRGLVGDLGSMISDISGGQAAKTTGTGSAYLLTTRSTITTLATGLRITIIPHANSLVDATLNVDILGAKQIQTVDGTNIIAGEMIANKPADLIYRADFNSAAGAWVLLNPAVISTTFSASNINNDSGVTGDDVAAALDALDTTKQATLSLISQTDAEAGTATGIEGWSALRVAQAIAALVPQGVPTGAVQFFGMSSAPTGWLKANGAAVSRTTYADLFAAIGTAFGTGDSSTTFNVPDLRGEFIRGFDDGRGVDSGRVFGSAQTDSLAPHDHTVDAPVYYGSAFAGNTPGWSQDDTLSSPSVLKTTSSTGDTETRPRNIALLACIKT